MDSLHQTVSKNLQCPICLELLQEPKLLSCKHMFCVSCLKTLFSTHTRRDVSCPVCRERSDIPDGDIETLPTNDAIKSLVEDVKNTREQCGNCPVAVKNVSTIYCQDCKTYLCNGCQKTHDSWREFSKHEIISVEDIRRGKAVPKTKSICREHKPEEGEYTYSDVCVTCEKVICMRCRMVVHEKQGHDVISLSEYKEKIHNERNALLKSANDKIASLKKIQKKIIQHESEIESHYEDQIEKIEDTYSISLSRLAKRKEALIDELVRHKQDSLRKISSPRKHISRIKNVMNLVTRLSKAPVESQDLSCQKSLSRELQEILDSDGGAAAGVTDVSKIVKTAQFRVVSYDELYLGEIDYEDLIPGPVVEFPKQEKITSIKATSNGKMAVCGSMRGVKIYNADGVLEQTFLHDREVVDIAFLSDDRCAVRDWEKLYLYSSEWEKLDVTFETLKWEVDESAGLTVDINDDHIYVGYWEAIKIQAFMPDGGEPFWEIDYDIERYRPDLLSFLNVNGFLLVQFWNNSVCVVNPTNKQTIKHKKFKKQYICSAVGERETILIASISKERDSVTIEQYTWDLKYMTTLISDQPIEKQDREWWYLQELERGLVAFCTCNKMYIFERNLTPVDPSVK